MNTLFCEVYTKNILPSLRALIARELINSYGYTQWSAAKALGITQPLINYYLKGRRGAKLLKELSNSKIIMDYVKLIAKSIAEGKLVKERIFCELCVLLRTTKHDVLKSMGIEISKVFYPRCDEV